MLGVLPAPPAVLGEFQTLAGIRLVLGGHIVATLAHLASQGDGGTFVRWHFVYSLVSVVSGLKLQASCLKLGLEAWGLWLGTISIF
jgi:hypothetical protein